MPFPKHAMPLQQQPQPSPSPRQSPTRFTLIISLSAITLALALAYLTLNTTSLSVTSFTSSQAPTSSPPCPSPPSPLNISYPNSSIPLAPSPLPAPHHASSSTLIPLILSLKRDTPLKLISKIPLQAETFEPEGLLLLSPYRLVLSSAEYTSPTEKYPEPINGTDRSPGSGHAHLQVFALDADAGISPGTLLADASLTSTREYHNGGLDFSGSQIYGVLSQRRPNSTATIYAADPYTLQPTSLIHLPTDHLGTLIVNPLRKQMIGLNWGGRMAYTFPLPSIESSESTAEPKSPLDTKSIKGDTNCECKSLPPLSTTVNPSHFIDYQDCKFLGQHQLDQHKLGQHKGQDLALCSGVASLQDGDGDGKYVLGGIALVDTETMIPVFEMPITLESEEGVRMTMNPFDVAVIDGKLRFYWAPDQHNTTLYIYEAEI